ncbi:hypothetical protein F4X86_00430 [Candidatus Saccharibacteria bacterium]|nr:hypothetical protein [Candidatus Saccharibacteria bacterium]
MEPGSRWFVYEADEFDRNFLSFKPRLSLIAGIDHDHPEVFPTMEDYTDAFRRFVDQSEQVVIGRHDAEVLYPERNWLARVETPQTKPPPAGLKLAGEVNRQNATLALAGGRAVLPDAKEEELIAALNRFPGSWRRFEELSAGLYTDYAHNPVKIAGCLQRAEELGKPVVVVYEPHSNQRQHLVKDQYRDLFKNVKRLYWLPTFLTREDPELPVLNPADFIKTLSNRQIASPAKMNRELRTAIERELAAGSIVVGMSASGLDGWLRENLGDKARLKF